MILDLYQQKYVGGERGEEKEEKRGRKKAR